MHARTVAEEDRVYDSRDPRKKIPSVAVADVGKCAATILLNPSPHFNKTYKLISDSFSMIDLSQTMTKILGRNIKVKETTWNQFRNKNLVYHKIPKWQIEGTIEWLKDDVNIWITGEDQKAIKTITGDTPITLKHFIATNANHFGWKPWTTSRRATIETMEDDFIVKNRRSISSCA